MPAQFLTTLDVRRLEDTSRDGRGTWQLLAELVFSSAILRHLVRAPAGFITDFASVPRLPVAFFLAGDSGHQAAVIHDWLYSAHLVDRSTADAVFREACSACSVPAWRAWLMWTAVRVGGAGAFNADNTPQPDNVITVLETAAA